MGLLWAYFRTSEAFGTLKLGEHLGLKHLSLTMNQVGGQKNELMRILLITAWAILCHILFA